MLHWILIKNSQLMKAQLSMLMQMVQYLVLILVFGRKKVLKTMARLMQLFLMAIKPRIHLLTSLLSWVMLFLLAIPKITFTVKILMSSK